MAGTRPTLMVGTILTTMAGTTPITHGIRPIIRTTPATIPVVRVITQAVPDIVLTAVLSIVPTADMAVQSQPTATMPDMAMVERL